MAYLIRVDDEFITTNLKFDSDVILYQDDETGDLELLKSRECKDSRNPLDILLGAKPKKKSIFNVLFG